MLVDSASTLNSQGIPRPLSGPRRVLIVARRGGPGVRLRVGRTRPNVSCGGRALASEGNGKRAEGRSFDVLPLV